MSGLRRALRWMFSFPAFLSTVLAGLTVLTVQSRFNDPDLWWHLRLGQIVWRTHSIPRTDIFSFTTHGHAWIPHEWLAQLSIYGVFRWGGYTGLMLWLCILACALVVLLYALCSLYSGNAKSSLLGGLAGWFFSTVGLAVRPLVIGHLLLVLELLLIHLARTRDRRWMLVLPPLFAVWVNCHGSYVAGIMVLGVAWFCSFFDLSAGSLTSRSWPAKDRRWLTIVGIACIAALSLNPVGIRLLVYPFDALLQQSNGMKYVSEWQPLVFNDAYSFGLLAVAALIFALVLLRRCELRLEELMLLALGFGMAIRHQRMLFVFGVLAAPIVSRLLSNLWETYDPRRDRRFPNAVLMLASAVVMVSVFPDSHELDAQVIRSSPVRAVEFIRRTGLSGPMMNEYEFGGYLIWALPEQKVFIDGRGDVYDWTGVFGETAKWALVQEDPNLLLNRYHINYCLLRRTAPMAQVLPLLPVWKQVYGDDLAVIFSRTESFAGSSSHSTLGQAQ